MPSLPLNQGDIVADKYAIEVPIGSGGFSHVFRARHQAMERTVALKVFDPQSHGADDPTRTAGRAQRFEREARLVSQLQHPNTVTIFDFGIENHRAYLVMEFIEGQTLKRYIGEQGPLDPDEAVTITLQILASLEEAHHRQILHRDLKPANIMLTSNFKGDQIVKVLDFGIARILESGKHDGDNDDERLFLGTPRYAAPEQIFMRDLTYATDIYGVGALLWLCLTGEPMVPTSDIKRCANIAKLDPPWRLPDDLDIGHGLRRVVEKAVAKDPSRRYQSTPQLAQALQKATSIDFGDLPEFEDDAPLGDQATLVDPNVVDPDGDEDNIFLNPDASSPPPTPYAALRQSDPSRLPPTHRKSGAGPSKRPSREPTPIPLDSPNPPRPSPEPAPAPMASSGPSSSPARAPEDRGNTAASSSPPLLFFGLAVVAVLSIAGLSLWWFSGDDAPPADEQAQHADVPDTDADEDASPSLADTSRFSVDGLLVALRSTGWRVRSPGDPRQLPNYDHRATVAEFQGERIDLNIYEVHDEETHQSLRQNIEFPERYLIFDHIFLHIHPRNSDAQFQTRELYNTLRDFRDEVESSSSP